MVGVFFLRGVAQFGRALRSGRRGRVFESRRLDFFLSKTESAEIAQSVEHFTRNEGVEGSSPFFSLKPHRMYCEVFCCYNLLISPSI